MWRIVCAITGLVLTLYLPAQATPINVCLASNGGVLEAGPETIRDGDWSNFAQHIGGQGGSIEAIITFPETSIEYVRYRLSGACYQYDGYAIATMDVYLRIDDAWMNIWDWYGTNSDHYDTDIATSDNGGLGWNDVSGMKLYSTISGSYNSTASVGHVEMEAWAVPEPATLLLLALGGLVGFRRRAWAS